ncbi:MAG: hypothetical protein J2P45_28275 [Candidatus Dormibacteraeota bacterium]|nr:hypothetical protein [Candidatus Dormibacteraeota bacterium]
MISIVSGLAGFVTIALVLLVMGTSRAGPAVGAALGLVVAVVVNRTLVLLRALRSAPPADGDAP